MMKQICKFYLFWGRFQVVMACILLLSSASFAHTGGSPVDDSVVLAKPYLRNVVRLTTGGTGSGYYIGDGKILTAAHNFTTSQFFPELFSDPVIVLYDGSSIELSNGDYHLLMDPQSGIEIKWDSSNHRSVVVPTNDVAILKVTNPKILERMPKKPEVSIGGVEVKTGMILEGLGLNENQTLTLLDALGSAKPVGGKPIFSVANFTIQEIREHGGKFVASPNGDYRTLPGDSGAPMFYRHEDGSVHLVSVHHAAIMDPGGQTFLPFSIDQLVSKESFSRFEIPGSQEWYDRVLIPSTSEISNIPVEVWREFVTTILKAKRQNMPTFELRRSVARKINSRFLWSLTKEEAEAVAVKIIGISVRAYDSDNFALVGERVESSLSEIRSQRTSASKQNVKMRISKETVIQIDGDRVSEMPVAAVEATIKQRLMAGGYSPNMAEAAARELLQFSNRDLTTTQILARIEAVKPSTPNTSQMAEVMSCKKIFTTR